MYYGSSQVVGCCSICGGRVTVPRLWWATVPPTPKCESCGAVAAPPPRPVIPMVPCPVPQIRHLPSQKLDNIPITPIYPGRTIL